MKKITNNYYIEIISEKELNEFTLTDICEYIEENYGHKPDDIKAKMIKVERKYKLLI